MDSTTDVIFTDSDVRAFLSLASYWNRELVDRVPPLARLLDRQHDLHLAQLRAIQDSQPVLVAAATVTMGQKFGRLQVIGKHNKPVFSSRGKRVNGSHFTCRCECGQTKVCRVYELKSGTVQSCGCLSREEAAKRFYKHGRSKSREYANEKHAKRKAAKLKRTPPWSDHDAIAAIYDKCPEGYHVDHIVPLQGEVVSGLHVPHNLQYLPAGENIAKSNRFVPQVESVRESTI